MPMVSGAPSKVNAILESTYQSALKKYPNDKEKASKIAWGAVKNAGWRKNKKGKWTKPHKKGKGMKQFFEMEIFSTGDYPQGKFTETEIDQVVNSYNSVTHEAPLTIGHSSDYKDSRIPAYGWVDSLKKSGNKIIAVVNQFSDALKDGIKNGMYKKRSVELYSPDNPNNPYKGQWALHSVAFLGAQPPAVKGLQDIAFCEFSEGETTIGIEFAETDWEALEDEAITHTIKEIKDEFDECILQLTQALVQDPKEDEDDEDLDEIKADCYKTFYDCYEKSMQHLNEHFAFQSKVNQLEKGAMTEMKEKLQSLINKFTNKKKESTQMDDNEKKEFKEKLDSAEQRATQAELELKEFKEKELAQKQNEIKEGREKFIKSFKEELIGKKYPVQKMESDGFFTTLTANLEALDVTQFGEGFTKPTYSHFGYGLIGSTEYKPIVEQTSQFDTPSEKTEFADQFKGNDVKGYQRVQFAEQYVAKHGDKVKGKTKEQKIANVIQDIMIGKLSQDTTLLQ